MGIELGTKEEWKRAPLRVLKGLGLLVVLIYPVAYVGTWWETGAPPALPPVWSWVLPWNTGANVEVGRVDFRRPAGVLLASFPVENHNAYAVKDVALRCETRGASGSPINTLDTVVYRVVPGREQIAVTDLNLGFVNQQTVGVRCWVTGTAAVN